MALQVWNGFAVDDEGNTLPEASVTVRDETDNSLPSVFADRAGASPLGNPFLADSLGQIEFYVNPGRYRITAVKGTTTIVYNNVSINYESAELVPTVATLAEAKTTAWSVGDEMIIADRGYSRWIAVTDGSEGAPDEYGLADGNGVDLKLVYDKLINVTWLGAIGDSTTDNSAVFGASVNLLPSNGGVLYFPPGNYLVDPVATQNIMVLDGLDNLTISGYGVKIFNDAVDLAATTAGITLFSVSRCTRLTFEGINMQLKVTSVAGATSQTIELVKVEDPLGGQPCEDITFRDCRFNAVNLSPEADWGTDSASGELIPIPEGDTDTGNANDYKIIGLYFRGDHTNDIPHKNITIESCRFEEMTARTCWIWHCADVFIANNSFQNSGARRPQIRCIVSNRNIKIDNNVFYDDNPNGDTTWIYLNRQAGIVYPGEFTVSNNTFYYGIGSCVELDGVSNVAVHGNVFKINPDYDVSGFDNTKGHRCQRGIKLASTVTTSGVTANIAITGNSFDGSLLGVDYPVNFVYEESIETYSPIKNLTISGNAVSNVGIAEGGIGAVVIGIVGIVTSFSITGNSFYNCARHVAFVNVVTGLISGNNFTTTNKDEIAVAVASGGVVGQVVVSDNLFTGTSSGIWASSSGWPASYYLLLNNTSGTFTASETLTGGTSGQTATFAAQTDLDFNQSDFDSVVQVTSPSGRFDVTETVTGGTSGVTGEVAYYAFASDHFVITKNTFINVGTAIRNFGSNTPIHDNYMSNVGTALNTPGGLATITVTNGQNIF